jgi:hypothetical protein
MYGNLSHVQATVFTVAPPTAGAAMTSINFLSCFPFAFLVYATKICQTNRIHSVIYKCSIFCSVVYLTANSRLHKELEKDCLFVYIAYIITTLYQLQSVKY